MHRCLADTGETIIKSIIQARLCIPDVIHAISLIHLHSDHNGAQSSKLELPEPLCHFLPCEASIVGEVESLNVVVVSLEGRAKVAWVGQREGGEGRGREGGEGREGEKQSIGI